ncbi:MAG: hypothetical protein LBV80_10040 [Deltaproteobacteria bacterium]|nr:hypothetical protein [Deltaproteobacteria bacterium]
MRNDLIRLARDKVIDKLFILDANYGISPACNLGWSLVDAPFFMKIDNDYEICSETWLADIFGMWGKARYSSIMGPVWGYDSPLGRVSGPHGTMWTLPVSFVGSAFLVSKKIREQIGLFCEDYGVYGEEDADYCMRCHHAGIRKYSFAPEPLMRMIGNDEAEAGYTKAKRALHAHNVGMGVGEGIFALNLFLYEHGLRSLNVPLKYSVADIRGFHVSLRENPEYAPYYDKLMQCAAIFNSSGRTPSPGDLERIRTILA